MTRKLSDFPKKCGEGECNEAAVIYIKFVPNGGWLAFCGAHSRSDNLKYGMERVWSRSKKQ